MVYFRETQSFARNPVIWIAVAGTVFVVFGTLSIPEVRQSGAVGLAVVAPLLVMAWLLLVRLETEVRDDGVHLRFRLLWFPKLFGWDRVESAEAVEYRPIVQYGGWGIRRGWSGEWAWNVSGSRGVRLHLRDGKRFLIGSDQPDALAAAIKERLGAAPRPS